MSKDYSFELQQIMSGINHLKGLISRNAASTSAPTIDFCCDMFDRPDAAVLNGYWGDTTGSWALVNQRAVFQGTDTAVLAAALTNISFTTSWSFNISAAFQAYSVLTARPLPAGNYRSNLYNGKMSTTDFQVKITFDVKAPATLSNATTITPITNTFAGGTITSTTLSQTSYPQFTGIAIGSATVGRTLGISYSGSPTPAVNLPSVTSQGASVGSTVGISSATTDALSYAAGNDLSGQFGLLSAATALTAGQPFQNATTMPGSAVQTTGGFEQLVGSSPESIFTQARTSATSLSAAAARIIINPAAPPVLVGTNTLLVQMFGNVYNIYLNGVLWQTITQAIMTDRSQPGLLSQCANLLGYFVTNGIAPYGISSFKAWPMISAEPANQTGRGTYASGYSDRYHDAAGNYNPLA